MAGSLSVGHFLVAATVTFVGMIHGIPTCAERIRARFPSGEQIDSCRPVQFGERPLCVHTPCTWLRMYSHEHHRWILRIARRSRSAERSNKEKRISRVARKARGRKNTGGPQLRYMDAVFLPAKRHRAPPAKVCAAVLLMERAVIYHGAFARPSFVGRLFRPPASSLDGESLCADLRRSSLVKGPGSCTAAVACSAGRASSLDAFARREGILELTAPSGPRVIAVRRKISKISFSAQP
ncbi:hypothetical protein MRX96_033607 [Rhipicephalus microplus]